MSRKPKLLPLSALLASCFAISSQSLGKDAGSVYSGLTAHEWGTFTSIAGSDWQAVEWSPLSGSTDLPVFVEHFRDPGFKLGLRGTVRMETPVLYFYASREETVSVQVAFANGVITEWYPHASRVETAAGDQQEKFLFYRGVSTFSVPLSATLGSAGKVRIQNQGDQEIPTTILFERRGEKVGYSIGSAINKEAILDHPA